MGGKNIMKIQQKKAKIIKNKTIKTAENSEKLAQKKAEKL